jgi:hypothetical protein
VSASVREGVLHGPRIAAPGRRVVVEEASETLHDWWASYRVKVFGALYVDDHPVLSVLQTYRDWQGDHKGNWLLMYTPRKAYRVRLSVDKMSLSSVAVIPSSRSPSSAVWKDGCMTTS